MTKDEFIATVAKVLAGLQVPASMGMLGTAREPWAKLHELAGMGWHDAEEYEQAIREVLAA